MTPIEIIALILILVAAIKMFVLLVNPKAWMSFAKGIYSQSGLAQFVGLILAAVVLYYLLKGGMGIVGILAATVFAALLLLVGIAPSADSLIKKYQAQIKRGKLWKENWLYTLLWIALLVWGVKELFF